MSDTRKPHCGNCKHFHGIPVYDSFGLCRITLPPWMPEDEGQSRSVHRADICDLHKPMEVQP